MNRTITPTEVAAAVVVARAQTAIRNLRQKPAEGAQG